jgi:topoisomerase IV subunit A
MTDVIDGEPPIPEPPMDPGSNAGRIIDEPLEQALSSRYLAYALSTITSRALPDVRDGLKPVHRRLLFAMRDLNLDAASAHKKSARVVGDVMGRFHPHGDQSIYDALVRLAQDFNVRYPLVDGQGNFGNIDGDNPAAMRYTESRLTLAAERLLDGLDEDAVDFRDNYSGEESEPVVLPGGFPNLLANGALGIAVGMATSIPPHNVAELLDASIKLVEDPETPIEDLVRIVPGPDFPTGGIMVESRGSILEAYRTGRGGFRLRAKWEVEDVGRGMWRIVVTEIPWQVQKTKLFEHFADLLDAKKLPLINDIRDESDDRVRIVIEPRARNVEPAMLMESLFRLSDLETRVSLNMNVLDAQGAPRVMNLKEVLQAWLDHRRIVCVRRARYRLTKIETRLEKLTGFIIAYLNLDEVIRIIREEDDPKAELIRTFALTDMQAEAILDMRLRSLRKLEEMELRREHESLTRERTQVLELLSDDGRQWQKVGEELHETRKAFGPDTPFGRRRSVVGDAPEPIIVTVDAFVTKEPITVLLSKSGWIRALKGHVDDLESVKFRESDGLLFSTKAQTTDKIILFATDGRAFTLGADKLPGGRGFGEPVRMMVELSDKDDIVAMFVHDPDVRRLVAGDDGYGFIVPETEMVAQKRAGRMVLNVGDAAKAATAQIVTGDHVAVSTNARRLLVFPMAELPEMGRGRGVKLISMKDSALVDVRTFAEVEGFSWKDTAGRERVLTEWREWLGRRASTGRTAPNGFPRSNRMDGK